MTLRETLDSIRFNWGAAGKVVNETPTHIELERWACDGERYYIRIHDEGGSFSMHGYRKGLGFFGGSLSNVALDSLNAAIRSFYSL